MTVYGCVRLSSHSLWAAECSRKRQITACFRHETRGEERQYDSSLYCGSDMKRCRFRSRGNTLESGMMGYGPKSGGKWSSFSIVYVELILYLDLKLEKPVIQTLK